MAHGLPRVRIMNLLQGLLHTLAPGLGLQDAPRCSSNLSASRLYTVPASILLGVLDRLTKLACTQDTLLMQGG